MKIADIEKIIKTESNGVYYLKVESYGRGIDRKDFTEEGRGRVVGLEKIEVDGKMVTMARVRGDHGGGTFGRCPAGGINAFPGGSGQGEALVLPRYLKRIEVEADLSEGYEFEVHHGRLYCVTGKDKSARYTLAEMINPDMGYLYNLSDEQCRNLVAEIAERISAL